MGLWGLLGVLGFRFFGLGEVLGDTEATYQLNTPFMKSTTKTSFVMSLMLSARQLERPNLSSAEIEWSKRPSVTWIPFDCKQAGLRACYQACNSKFR